MVISSKGGLPLKVDTSTSLTSCGKFARICVEVDLRKNLVSKVILKVESYLIEYEGLKIICFACGKYGHHKEACSKVIEENAKTMVAMEERHRDKVKESKDSGMEANNNDTDSNGKKEEIEGNYGEWMIAKKRGRKPGGSNKRNNNGWEL